MPGLYRKTTVYLPDDLRDGMRRVARERGISESELIRQALATALEPHRPPGGAPFHSEAEIADPVDELRNEGFGAG